MELDGAARLTRPSPYDSASESEYDLCLHGGVIIATTLDGIDDSHHAISEIFHWSDHGVADHAVSLAEPASMRALTSVVTGAATAADRALDAGAHWHRAWIICTTCCVDNVLCNP